MTRFASQICCYVMCGLLCSLFISGCQPQKEKPNINLGEAGDMPKNFNHNELKDILHRAKLGNAFYQHLLANCYRYGHGTPIDHKKAMAWDEKAAKQDHLDAIYYVARGYFNGEGVDKQSATGIKWYKRGASLGHTDCMMDLAYIYLDGRGTFRNKEQAYVYFTMAAKAGDKSAQEFLLMRTGKQVHPD